MNLSAVKRQKKFGMGIVVSLGLGLWALIFVFASQGYSFFETLFLAQQIKDPSPKPKDQLFKPATSKANASQMLYHFYKQ